MSSRLGEKDCPASAETVRLVYIIPINTKTISSVQKMQRMLICEWFVYYGEIKDKLVLTVENIINNEYIRGRADRLFLADLFKRRSL